MYESIKETAVKVRKRLKKEFPKLPARHFSVRVDNNFNTISISWKDYPSEKEIRDIVSDYVGVFFDGQIDLEIANGYVDPETGQRITSSARFSYYKTTTEDRRNKVRNYMRKLNFPEEDIENMSNVQFYELDDMLDHNGEVKYVYKERNIRGDKEDILDNILNDYKKTLSSGRFRFYHIQPLFMTKYIGVNKDNFGYIINDSQWEKWGNSIREYVGGEFDDYCNDREEYAIENDFITLMTKNKQDNLLKTDYMYEIGLDYKKYHSQLTEKIHNKISKMFEEETKDLERSVIYNFVESALEKISNDYSMHSLSVLADLDNYILRTVINDLCNHLRIVPVETKIEHSYYRCLNEITKDYVLYSNNSNSNFSAIVLEDLGIVSNIRNQDNTVIADIVKYNPSESAILYNVTNRFLNTSDSFDEDLLKKMFTEEINRDIVRMLEDRCSTFTIEKMKDLLIKESLTDWFKEKNIQTIPNDILQSTTKNLKSSDEFKLEFSKSISKVEFKKLITSKLDSVYGKKQSEKEGLSLNDLILKICKKEEEYLANNSEMSKRNRKLLNKSKGLGLGEQPFSAKHVTLGMYFTINKTDFSKQPHILINASENIKLLIFPHITYVLTKAKDTETFNASILYSLKSQTIQECQEMGRVFNKNLESNNRNLFSVIISNLSLK